MPMDLWYIRMVTSPTGKGVIAMGGQIRGSFSRELFELTEKMVWKRLEPTLRIYHWVPLVIPVPDDMVATQEQLNYWILDNYWHKLP